MPDIVGSHNGSQVFCSVVLLPVERFEDTLDPQRLSRFPNLQVLKALIDTGAQGTSITLQAAEKLNLEPTGRIRVHGFGGAKDHNCYLFKVGFVDLRESEFGGQSPNFHIVDFEIQGAEFDCGPDADFDVLLGMDVLSIGTLTVANTGKFKFSF
ncbi:MAG: retropepsin-like aspartic protease [Erythrobacter sp.]